MSPAPQSKGVPFGSAMPTTSWTEVRRAAQGGDTQASASLERLCRLYWYPLYALVRGLGNSHDDAQELTQGFFEHLLGQQLLARADQMRGRFRNYLLLSCKSFIRDEWRKRNAIKRGGAAVIFSIDAQEADNADTRYRFEPVDKLDAEKIYQRRWALTLLAAALNRLEAEFKAADKAEQFTAMKPLLNPASSETTYAALAATLGVTLDTARVAVHRFRRRYREMLCAEVAE